MIELKNLTKTYLLSNQTTTILKDISLYIYPGLTLLTGESGSGKSTLLNIIGGMDRTTSGQVIIDGINTSEYNEEEWANIRGRKIGFIFQQFNLIEHLTALRNVEIAMEISGYKKKEKRKRALALLDKVGLKDRASYYPSQLSGGQKQRVAIARALANNPDILLADEPTGALDQKNSNEIMNILKTVADEGKTVITVTHSNDFSNLANEIIRLEDGKIVSVQNSGVCNNYEKKQSFVFNKKKPSLNFFTTLKLSLSNVKKKKKRMLLTALGASVGIFGIFSIYFLTYGLNMRLDQTSKNSASQNIISVQKNDGKLLTQTDKNKIQSDNPQASIENLNTFTSKLTFNKKSVIKTAMNFLKNTKVDFLTDYSLSNNENEIFISEELAETLFGEISYSIGQSIQIDTELVGTTTNSVYPVVSTTAKIGGVFKDNSSNSSEIYYSQALSNTIMDQSDITKNQSSTFILSFDKVVDYGTIMENLEKSGYTTGSNSIKKLNQIITTGGKVLMFLSGISLVVSTIMIAIVLYVSVTERRKEIGILKSLGTYSKDIRQIFISEGLFIGFSGGIVGISGAVLFANLANRIVQNLFKDINFGLFQYNMMLMVVGVIFSVILGLVGAYFPALKASRQMPLDSLRATE